MDRGKAQMQNELQRKKKISWPGGYMRGVKMLNAFQKNIWQGARNTKEM